MHFFYCFMIYNICMLMVHPHTLLCFYPTRIFIDYWILTLSPLTQVPIGITWLDEIHSLINSSRRAYWWGACVARSVECQTLGFSWGHDVIGGGKEPHVGFCTQRGVCLKILSPSPPSSTRMLSLPNKQINLFEKFVRDLFCYSEI